MPCLHRAAVRLMAGGDVITRRLRQLLEDWLTANSTLIGIENLFGDADIPFTKVSGGNAGDRRTMVRGFYATLDPGSRQDLQRFLNVLAAVMERIEEREAVSHGDTIANAPDPLAAFHKEIGKLAYAYADGRITATSVAARLDDARAHAEAFDLAHLHEHIRRIEGAVDIDPGLAIGSAKELIETTAKTILDARGTSYAKTDDLPKLTKAVCAALGQLPDGVPEAARGADAIRRTLSNLASIVQGLAELRSLYGTGHGRTGTSRGLKPRHARLAVGAAATLATYLFDTHKETPLPSPGLPR